MTYFDSHLCCIRCFGRDGLGPVWESQCSALGSVSPFAAAMKVSRGTAAYVSSPLLHLVACGDGCYSVSHRRSSRRAVAEQRRSIHDEGAAIEVFGALPLFVIQPTTTASVAVPHTLLAHPADRQRTLFLQCQAVVPKLGAN